MKISDIDFSLLNLSSESKILDLGCGRGKIIIPLWEKGLFAVGIDLGIDYLKELLNNSRLSAGKPERVAVALGEQLPFRSGFFDIVVCSEVLEHVSDPKAVLEDIHRVLRPNGHLILTVPYNVSERLLNLVNPSWLSTCGHRSVFSRQYLSHMLKHIGFDLKSISKEHFFYTYFWFFHCIFRTRHDGVGRPLENHWLTEKLYTLWNRFLKIRGGYRTNEFGNSVLPKSIYFYCKKI